MHISGTASTVEVENGLLGLCRTLRRWATFDEHLGALEASGYALSGRELAEALQRLQDAGILWFEDEFLSGVSQSSPPAPPPITTFVVPTRDRPRELRRCLESFFDRMADPGRLRLLVCDDSDGPGARANVETLQGVGRRFGVRCQHLSVATKRRLIDHLKERGARKGISGETIPFILDGGFGAARNLALLLTAGEMILSTDDDTLASAAAGQEPDGLEVSSVFSPTASDLFPTAEQCDAAVAEVDRRIVSEHERFLGKGVGAIMAERRGSAIVLSECTAEFSRDLVSFGGSAVLTCAGVLGDSALGNPRMVFHLDGEQRTRYVDDTEAYESARLTRIVFRRVQRPVVTNSPWLTTVNHAADNRSLIPPTFPFGRNEDGLMGVLVRACRPDAYIVHLPLGVRHAPPAPRTFLESDLHSFTPRICDFMIHAVHGVHLNPLLRSPSDRREALATHFGAMGSLALPEFAEAVRAVWMSFADGYVSNMEARLEQYRYSPEAWALDVERHLESLLTFLRSSAALLPVEFAGSPSATENDRLRSFQRSVGLFGNALAAWPILREIALDEALRETVPPHDAPGEASL